MRRLLALLAVAMFFVASVLDAAPVWSMPPSMVVHLFDAYAPVDRIVLKGPLQLLEPTNKIIAGEHVKLIAKNDRVEVLVLNQKSKGHSSYRPLLASRRVVISSLMPRGVEVQREPGLRRLYRGVLTATAGKALYGGRGMRNRRIYGSESRETRNSLKLVNEIPIRDYIASVAGSELPSRAPEEAVKAVAVLALNIIETKPPGSDVADTTAEQAYKGNEHVTPVVDSAVAAVLGKRLLNGNVIAKVFYHSTCAGGTSSGESIFGENARGLTYLKPVRCQYCRASPFWKEKRMVLNKRELLRMFGGALPAVRKTDSAGRPTEVVLSPGVIISGYECWLRLGRRFGWKVAPGTRFSFRALGFDEIEVTSTGAGHGVGLCQWGAIGMAKQGKKYDEILRFYFPGTKLK